MILLDTNVMSEPLRHAPEPRVIEWIDAQAMETLFLSAITVAELRAGVALLPAGKRPPALMMSLHVWAMAHGIASLFGRGDAASRKLPMQPEELLEAGVLLYLRGLGLPEA